MQVEDLFLIRFYHDIDGYEKIPCLDLQSEIAQLMEQRKIKLDNWDVNQYLLQSTDANHIDFSSKCLL